MSNHNEPSFASKITAEQPRRGLLVGEGYFSDFHLDAWNRMDRAQIVCVCDLDLNKAKAAAAKHNVPHVTDDLDVALQRDDLDFVDIATGPTDRVALIERVLTFGRPVICQKPLANDFRSACKILDAAESSNLTFMVHENFRFQPWYRELKRLLESGVIGKTLHAITMRTRLGDGWGDDAYLDRQPYFRSMPRLLIQETGVHFVDTFRFLGGEVESCRAELRRLNPCIAGEDAGVMTLRLESGATATWDANRYNESASDDPRYTFGEMLVEANGGSLSLSTDGSIQIQPLGQSPYRHDYTPSRVGFAGDCVRACQEHFIDVLEGNARCETSPSEYRKSLRVVEAVYAAARNDRRVSVSHAGNRQKQVIDLSLPMATPMPGVQVEPCKSIESDGWNATTLTLYSHAGTHIDAPKHFCPDGNSLDQQDLSVCCGPARMVSLPLKQPSDLIGVDDVLNIIGDVFPGDRLLFRTDWHKQFGTADYRHRLPRISLPLAEWLVEKRVALIGVEPPSVADVNNRDELTRVHQTLFRGNVVIVEGLANLDQLTDDEFEFVALPLKIVGGDGCPVRAVAIQ